MNFEVHGKVVPCGKCQLCCHAAVIVSEDYGDEVDRYLTQEMVNPQTRQWAKFLARRPDGGCFYLGKDGCTIHKHAPAMCRAYDCRAQLANLGPLADLVMHPDIQAAARARMGTGD